MQAAILRQKYPSYWLPFLKAPYSLIYAVGPYFGLPRDLIKCALLSLHGLPRLLVGTSHASACYGGSANTGVLPGQLSTQVRRAPGSEGNHAACVVRLSRHGYGKTPMFDTKKAREELGMRFLSPEVMLWDEAARLHELGLVKRWFGLF